MSILLSGGKKNEIIQTTWERLNFSDTCHVLIETKNI